MYGCNFFPQLTSFLAGKGRNPVEAFMGPKVGEAVSGPDNVPEFYPPGSKQIKHHPRIVNFSTGLLISCQCLESIKNLKEANQLTSCGKGWCRYLIISTSSTF